MEAFWEVMQISWCIRKNVLIPCWFLSYQEPALRGREDPGQDSGPRGLDLTTQLSEVLHICLHQSSFSRWVHQRICAAGADELLCLALTQVWSVLIVCSKFCSWWHRCSPKINRQRQCSWKQSMAIYFYFYILLYLRSQWWDLMLSVP